MRISTKCSVALHCLVVIHEFSSKKKVTGEILSKSTGCNAAAIRSIMLLLQKAGLVSINRGVGGAALAKSPEEISIWDVYSAVEPEALEHLIGIHPSPSDECPVGQQMHTVLKTAYQEIGNSVKGKMAGITLQQILDKYHSFSA